MKLPQPICHPSHVYFDVFYEENKTKAVKIQ